MRGKLFIINFFDLFLIYYYDRYNFVRIEVLIDLSRIVKFLIDIIFVFLF